MNTQMTSQPPSQDAPEPRPYRGYGFRKGVSGNRSGVTLTMRWSADLVAEFKRVRGRSPTPVEIISIKNAGALAARIAANKIPATEQVRAGNLLSRLLAKLGLDAKPDNPKPRVPSLAELEAGK
jgi:hypothetical protein